MFERFDDVIYNEHQQEIATKIDNNIPESKWKD